MSKNTFTLNKDEKVILVIGAEIHHPARLKNERGRHYVKRLTSWDGIQSGLFSGKEFGQPLAWELNALQEQYPGEMASWRLSEQQKDLTNRLRINSARALKFGWAPPIALQMLINQNLVSDIISLNVDLILESWLADNYSLSGSQRVRCAVETGKKPNKFKISANRVKPGKSEGNKSRHQIFNLDSNISSINFWYPHDDISDPSSLQFSLGDYAKSHHWMQNARTDFKKKGTV